MPASDQPSVTAPAAPDKGDSKALYVLLSVVFINIAGFGVIIPLLPFYAKSFGAPDWQVFVLFLSVALALGHAAARPRLPACCPPSGRRPRPPRWRARWAG